MDSDAIRLFKPKQKRQKVAHEADSTQGPPNACDPAAAPLVDRASGVASTSHSIPTDTSVDTFKSLGVTDWLCNVCKSLGITKPTQVQVGCIPAILEGKDVIGTAQTGSGKTAAFALPILQQLAHDPYGVYALVLTPTRELAVQLAEQFRAFGAGMNLKDATIIGGLDMQQQARALARRPHVVIATPGRLQGLLENDVTLKKGFSRTKFLVLDEADRLLDPSFEDALRSVLSVLPQQDRQTLLFSATMTKSLVKLQAASLQHAFVFQAYEGLHTAEGLREQYVFVPSKIKDVYLYHLITNLQQHKVRSAIVFVSTCRGCQLLSLLLKELGLPCAALHSGKAQKQRLAALNAFKSEMVPLLLATDVASRGLDIPTVDLVINYDLPVLARDYVHRVGRTARAGRSGWSVSFVTQYDVELVHAIEGLIGHELQAYDMPEEDVLKAITRVYAAKRAAMLALIDEESKQGVRIGYKKRNLLAAS
eukprot:jgi/Chrzof1/7933/Cz02g41230.t1